jgi:lupus La protein
VTFSRAMCLHAYPIRLHMPSPMAAPLALLQVEFYFSNSNLPRDAFLKEKAGPAGDQYVDIALICTFSRMAALLRTANKEVDKVPEETVAGVCVNVQ